VRGLSSSARFIEGLEITTCPGGAGGAPIDISEQVRGRRTIYVRARMKGRDDGQDSALAQFLRTSTLPDGHINLKSPYVFEPRAYEREVPIVTGSVWFNDGWSRRLWIDTDGIFWLDRVFHQPGDYLCRIEVSANPLERVSKTLRISCTPARLALSGPKP
jgi:hypothetical protein